MRRFHEIFRLISPNFFSILEKIMELAETHLVWGYEAHRPVSIRNRLLELRWHCRLIDWLTCWMILQAGLLATATRLQGGCVLISMLVAVGIITLLIIWHYDNLTLYQPDRERVISLWHFDIDIDLDVSSHHDDSLCVVVAVVVVVAATSNIMRAW